MRGHKAAKGPDLRTVLLFYESLWCCDAASYVHQLERQWAQWRHAAGTAAVAARVSAHFSPLEHVHAHLILGSRTLLESFERAVAFYGARNPHTRYEMDTASHRVRISVRYPEGVSPGRDDAEYRLMLMANIIRWVTPVRGEDILMQFRHGPPPYQGELERLADCPMGFNADEDALLINPRIMSARIWGSDTVASKLGRLFEEDLAAHSAPRTLAARVGAAIREGFPRGETGIKAVAARFGVTPRTLQRHLAGEGTSFHQVLSQAKQRLCGELIQDSTRPIGEIARFLGYSNPSNFTRAFREWFGTTPARMRHRLGLGHSENGS
jgi:AraC-like DNA-binding protein